MHLPPLRERPGDIAQLARYFVENIGVASGTPKKTLSPASLRKLESHDWPGNVRELYNVVHRAVLIAPGPQMSSFHIDLSEPSTPEGALADDFRKARQRVIESFEKRYIEEILRKHQGNVTHAALEAGKDRRVFGRLMKKYGIDRFGL